MPDNEGALHPRKSCGCSAFLRASKVSLGTLDHRAFVFD